jgi:hypothetical protein
MRGLNVISKHGALNFHPQTNFSKYSFPNGYLDYFIKILYGFNFPPLFELSKLQINRGISHKHLVAFGVSIPGPFKYRIIIHSDSPSQYSGTNALE